MDANRVTAPLKPRANGWDVYVYFDNDAKVHAPFNAEALAARLAAQPARQSKSA